MIAEPGVKDDAVLRTIEWLLGERAGPHGSRNRARPDYVWWNNDLDRFNQVLGYPYLKRADVHIVKAPAPPTRCGH